MTPNKFKRELLQALQIGLWCSLCSPITTEIEAASKFDWMLLDTEHAPAEIADLLPLLQASQTGPVSAVVRPAWNDPVLIKRVLDLGAQSILVPYIESTSEAQRAVAATRYPPEGIRGVTSSGRAARYGRDAAYFSHASDDICVFLQVETQKALDELETIATVPGVDGVFIGPSDLAASFGEIGKPNAPVVQHAIKDAVERLRRVNVPAGILTALEQDAARYIDWGFTFVAAGSDLNLLVSSVDNLARRFRPDAS